MDARRWDEWAALFAIDAVLDASEDMPFHGFEPKFGVVRGRDRIVAGMIDWRAKSENLRQLAARLNLGLVARRDDARPAVLDRPYGRGRLSHVVEEGAQHDGDRLRRAQGFG